MVGTRASWSPRRTAVSVLFALVAFAMPAPVHAQIWAPDDRIVITFFGDVAAMTFDGRRLFAATPNGMQIYDAFARRWLLPSTIEDGYPFFERPAALVYDRAQGGVWLLAASGNSYVWSELSGNWDARMPGDRPRVDPAERVDADIALRAMRGTLSVDPTGRRWPTTAIVAADRPGTYWIGTGGGGVVFADSRSLSTEWLPYGTLSTGIGAVAVDEDGGVWFGSDGYGPRAGMTHADEALQSWRQYEAYAARAPRARVHRILAAHDTIWAAADDGLYMLQPGARSWQHLEERDGLPSNRVGAVAETSAGLWAGTARGLVLVDPSSMSVIWQGMAGAAVNGLAVLNDTLWISSDRGLWRAAGTDSAIHVFESPSADSEPALRGYVSGVARAGDAIAALVNGRVYMHEGGWLEPITPRSGLQAYGLRAAGSRLLILARDGVEELNLQTKNSINLNIPNDIPEGPILDAAASGEFVWVATPRGAVRLRRP